ncbi:hypothetical protein, partial [Plesiomonas sp. ZOR0011]|uniref:hypothetical protein n=1 Tax=Plesiomonas sp. ZOR0011 TaxID=1339230 RepID=UPI001C47CBFB
MGGIFKSDSGFATLDLSTGKHLFSVTLVRRAEPLEKSTCRAVPSSFLTPLFGSSKTSKKTYWARSASFRSVDRTA